MGRRGITVIAAGGVVFLVMVTIVWGGNAETRNPLPALNDKLAEVATAFKMAPEVPPGTEIKPTHIVTPAGGYIPGCWKADTTHSKLFTDISTVAADERSGELHGFAKLVNGLRVAFTANSQSADSVRLNFTDLSLTTADHLRFQWDDEDCWLAVRSEHFAVVSGVLRFGSVSAEGVRSAKGTAALDSLQVDRIASAFSSSGKWERDSDARIRMRGNNLVIGTRRRAFGVRQLSCPDTGTAELTEKFQVVNGCLTYNGRGAWYRAKINRQGTEVTLVASSQDYPDGKTVRVHIEPGEETPLLERGQNFDRVVVDQVDGRHFVRFIRYELYEIPHGALSMVAMLPESPVGPSPPSEVGVAWRFSREQPLRATGPDFYLLYPHGSWVEDSRREISGARSVSDNTDRRFRMSRPFSGWWESILGPQVEPVGSPVFLPTSVFDRPARIMWRSRHKLDFSVRSPTPTEVNQPF